MGNAHGEQVLVKRIADQFGSMLADSLPRIAEAIDSEDTRQASFTVTTTFKRGKDKTILAKIMPRERIPMAGVEMKLQLDDGGQLSLFGDGEERVIPAQPGMDDGEDEKDADAESDAAWEDSGKPREPADMPEPLEDAADEEQFAAV